MRDRMKIIGTIVAGAFLLPGTGCMITGRTPPDLAHVSITTVDSPAVSLDHVRLVRDSGELFVTGHVFKRPGPGDTASTHLDVTWLDAAGLPLHTITGDFTPRDLVRRGPRPAVGTFRIRLAIPPIMPHRIEVRAHAAPCLHDSEQPDPAAPVDFPHELSSASRQHR